MIVPLEKYAGGVTEYFGGGEFGRADSYFFVWPSGAMAQLVECVPNFSEGRNKEVFFTVS